MEKIFVPLEIAKKLKDIGFDEPCVGFYADRNEDGDLFDGWKIFMEIDTLSYGESINLTDDFQLFDYNDVGWISVPTWEQVFAWFRNKGYYGNIHKIEGLNHYLTTIADNKTRIYESDCVYEKYKDAQEQLVLEMIEIYRKK